MKIERWPRASMALHWTSAAVLVGLVTAGFVMTNLPADGSGRLLVARLHALGGGALVALTLMRLAGRRRGPVTSPVASRRHNGVIQTVHVMLYVAIFAVAGAGVVTGVQGAWWKYLSGETHEAPKLELLVARQSHEALVYVLLAFVMVHVAGVMLQQVRRGGALERMLPFFEERPHGLD